MTFLSFTPYRPYLNYRMGTVKSKPSGLRQVWVLRRLRAGSGKVRASGVHVQARCSQTQLHAVQGVQARGGLVSVVRN